MKTLRKMKKGFTIVELVIVIAVIAVLTAILVPTFISISNKANEASDKSLVKNLNTALRMAEGEQGKKNETMFDAVEDVKEYAGIMLTQFVSKSGDEILWDSVADEFVWKTAKPEGRADVLLWTIVDSYDSSKQTYSMFAGSKWSSSAVSVEGLTVGFDVGYHSEITTVSYTRADSATAQTAIIRTYGSDLTVNAPNDDVAHYGWVKKLTVTAVRPTHCYHEWGFVETLVSFGTGKFVVESTALFHQTKTEVAAKFEGKTDSYVEGKDSQYSQHIYDEEGVCIVEGCGATTETHVHSFGAYGYNATGHWGVCSSCGAYETEVAHTFGEGLVTKEPTCTESGTEKFVCTVCEYEKIEEIPALNHSYLNAFLSNATGHWHKCERCDATTAPEAHTMTYSNNTGDTHDETCSACGYTKTGVAHVFTNGVCVCGKEEVTAPVEVHLTGVVGYANQSDHYTDSNTLIGTWDANQHLTYYNSMYLLVHTLTVTYTIPADTPANATIICDPVTEWSEFLEDIWPGAGFGYTYKIVNNSSHNFDIKQTDVHSDVVEAISKSNAIVKVGNDYKVLKNDNTYFDLDTCYIPYMTKCSYFNNYITWLKNSGATTQTSATSTFMGQYYNTFANSSDKSFYYYLDTEVVQKGTSWDNVLDVLCGSPSSSADNITYNSNDAQYVECELIRLMMKFSYEKAFGFVFVQNTENGWRNGAYQKIYKNNEKANFGTGFYGWDTCDPTTLKAYNFLELCEDGASLNYLKNGNTISGGIACLWHAYAGNAWQGVKLCDAPQFTIVLEAQ